MNFGTIIEPVERFLQATHLLEQIQEVDAAGLFTNPWFLVPFVAATGYLIYRQAFRDLIIIGGILGVWYASGTPYMQGLVVGGVVQINKVLPVLFGGAVILGVLIYLLLGRSD